jgi:large subunit ribosomal protein L10
MNRTEKQELIDDLHQEFGRSPHAIVVDFRGLSVPAVTEFRRKVRKAGSRYRVVKNTLALRAIKDTPLEPLGGKFENTTGVAYTGDDPVALAKVLIDFAKDHPARWCRVRRCSTPTASRRCRPCPACPSCARSCWV